MAVSGPVCLVSACAGRTESAVVEQGLAPVGLCPSRGPEAPRAPPPTVARSHR